ncbi:Hpt domain-containing protein [Stenotrophomonas sp. 24(2023)]|uniref:hybrid sensor histidine kinase/response regulator n=1 Tax=Stenotrophomonas sp. 24(2023) TaxID=3068324 RepID=UPI0027DEDD33|nr:Hpt domain-containing protein [Stenotrophomonas sp. 24(2023)]WMJ70198.1 Hpt domain-containing protein [Stenotrophomonas sp. 24(2023)]
MNSLRDAMSHAALGWVKPELDETLRQARNEVEYFAEDPADGSRMRLCAGYLHQVQGTLRMVELYAPAMVAEELEQLAHAVGAGDVPDRDEACATLMRGSVLLPDYLERLQNGHRDIPIVLLPLLNDIRAARGAPGINESVLFAFAPDSASASEAELDHARGSLSGRNRELLDTVGSAVKEELLRIKDALDLHLRTGAAPEQLHVQAQELNAVADTLGMMGLGVARNVVVQQRDALQAVVKGEHAIDEGLLLDIAGALLYVDASLDDQVAHLGAGGSGEDDPSVVESRRTVEVLAHEAIANFAAAREHFVAFIETSWNHAELQDVPRLVGEVAGALRMLDLGTAADYLIGVQRYIATELVGRQRVPSGRQLDTLADAMASLEYYLEALRDRRPGREDILDITRSSLESLRYWPLPPLEDSSAVAMASALDEGIAPVVAETIVPVPFTVEPAALAVEVTPAGPAPGSVRAPLPDVTFDPLPDAPPAAPAAAPLVFAATTAPVPDVPLWDVVGYDLVEPAVALADVPATPVAHWQLDADRPPMADADVPADATGESSTVATPSPLAFDPVAAEHALPALAEETVTFHFDSAALDNADDVLSLEAMETLPPLPDDDATAHWVLQADDHAPPLHDGPAGAGLTASDAAAADDADADADPGQAAAALPAMAPTVSGSVVDAAITPISFSDEDAAFLADLSAAAADFNPHAPAPLADAGQVAAAAPGIEAGFEDDAENIDQDIREVFLEEFDDELGNLATLLPAWRAQPDSVDRLRPIRRVFHTLKGSGRLVGARTLGEFAWKIEGMLNRVLDGSRPASPAVVAMVDQAHQALPQLNAALRHGQRVTMDLQAMQAIADRVAGGEETFYVALASAAPPAAPAVDAVPPPAAIAMPEADLPAAPEGTPANIDSVLLEILEAEVDTHQATLQAWLQSAQQAPQPVSDALLRAVHTMNGAFAMTDVPEITAVTGGAESYIKRALAADVVPAPEAVDALADTARAIAATMRALQAEQPRIALQEPLAQRLRALAAQLPEAQWPAMGIALDDGDDLSDAVAGDEPHDVQDDASAAIAAEEDVVPSAGVDDAAPAPLAIEEAVPPQDMREPLRAGADTALAEPVAVPERAELTASDDLSRYFDLAQTLPAAEPVAAPAAEVVGNSEEGTAEAPAVEAPDVALTGADDLSAFLDADVLPVGEHELPVWDEDELAGPVAVAVEDSLLNAVDAGDDDLAALDSDADSLHDEEAVPAFGEPVALEVALAAGLHVIEDAGQEQDRQGPWPVLGLQASERAPGEAEAFAEEADVGGTAAVGEGESIDLPPPATVHGEAGEDAVAASPAAAGTPVPFFEMEQAPGGIPTTDEPAVDEAAPVVPAAVSVAAEPAHEADALDFTLLDRELVDIFVEEGKDLLDHCDGLISELRNAPQDRDVLAGLQRDLHTLKGGARMAGINAIGDLGHGIESLLEAVAAGRTDIERSDVHLLERGFDRLHQMLTRTGDHRQVAAAGDLVTAFELRTRGDSGTVAPAAAEVDAAAVAPSAPAPLSAPLSAPLPAEGSSEDDPLARPQQEQVRVRADLLDRLVNHAGEVAIYRSRLEQQLGAFRGAMGELERTNARLRDQLRRLDLETEAQIVARYQREQDHADQKFDPLELDRFSTLQQLSRALNESAADLGGLQAVLDDLSRQYDGLLQQQSRVSSELQDGLMRARMVPFDGLVPRLRRVVRQAGLDTGKQVHLTLEGTHGELDRNVLDRMVAPLEHMLRNSVAHGLEVPEQRRVAGKPEEGEIAIRLHREGSEIVLDVADDGAGLDREAIRRRAIDRGLLAPDAQPGEQELDNLIFASGFTTVDQVSQLAGRGVGMDVVRNEVRQLGGTVDIQSVRGQGVRFTLRLPQTLAVTQAVFVQIGETTFAVPVASVSGIGRLSRERFESADSTYRYGGEDYTLYDLGTLVGQAPARADGQAQVPLLLVRAGDLRAAVAIDQVLGNREIVVKPVGLQIASVPGIYGATITGDGRVVVILDVAPLVRRHLANPQAPVAITAPRQERQVPLVMVVDDSLTMRKVTSRILERHNFEVSVARDGVEALEHLEERVPDLMLLDIEMPRMDGYELATAMRADDRFRAVPIVMITSRSGDKHRQRAFEIGVQRYLGKPYQELDLMRNVYDLLGIARVRE